MGWEVRDISEIIFLIYYHKSNSNQQNDGNRGSFDFSAGDDGRRHRPSPLCDVLISGRCFYHHDLWIHDFTNMKL